jgi:hypothetical protein
LISTALVPVLAQVPTAPDSEVWNPRNTDDSQLVAPWAPNVSIPPNSVRNFNRFILPPPPSNTSPQTRLEIDELNQLAATRSHSRVTNTVTRWNFDPPASPYNDYFDYLVQKYVYSPPLAARCSAMLNQGIYAGLMAAWHNKYTYLRPRPDQVTGYAFQPSPLLPMPLHPAYPSGHSTSAGVFMAIGPACFPNEPVESFVALGRESSLARRQGGVHYYSDSVAGEALGYAVGSEVVRTYSADGSPLGGNRASAVYSRSTGLPRTTLRRRAITVTVAPQLAPGTSGGQRIILAPIQPFAAPPAVKNPPDERIEIPAASTTYLSPPRPNPVNPNPAARTAPAGDLDPSPAPTQTGAVDPDAPLAPAVP